MKKIVFTLCALLASTAAFAASPNFSVLDEGGNQPGKPDGIGKCIKGAWEASSPTDDQTTQAKAFVESVKTIVDQHKDAIKADFKALFGAWGKAPVIHDDVVTAETSLEAEIAPVRTAGRDALINILNLLSTDQRTTFDASFKDCLQAGNH